MSLADLPPDLPQGPSFASLEAQRRQGLTNRAIVVFLLVWGADCLYDLALGGTGALPTLAAGVLALIAAYALNRFGRLTAAGIVLVVAIDGTYVLPALIGGHPLDVVGLRLFFVLAEAVLVAAVVLPPISVFVVAAGNIASILVLIQGAPHTAALEALASSGQVARTAEQAIGLQMLVAAVAYFWVRSTAVALTRMDRAEYIALLQQRALARKEALEAEVAHLLDIHVRVANGDLGARAVLSRDRALWTVGSALNNLLSRYQDARAGEQRLEATERAAAELSAALQQAAAGQPTAWPRPTGTVIDVLAQVLRHGR